MMSEDIAINAILGGIMANNSLTSGMQYVILYV
jgi:hypothetical protein